MNDIGTITLETEHLILRKFKIDDAAQMYNNWATDPKCNKYLSWDLHKDIEETKDYIQGIIDSYEESSYKWVVQLKDTQELIGSISAVKIRKKDLNCEIGYCYGSKYWGNGYATEALRKVIEFFLNECGLYLVEARHLSGNPASGIVMEKAGMKKEAVLRDRRINKHTKELDDLIVYSITKDELK